MKARGTPKQAAGVDEVVTLRLAGSADRAALERLAGRDTAPILTGEILVAVVDGEARAAIAVADGTVIADPFRHTVHLIDLLRIRGAQLSRSRRGRRAGLPVRGRRGLAKSALVFARASSSR